MSTYALGLVSVSFRDRSPEEILAAAKKAGLSCIEWGSDVHAPCQDPQRLQHIAALQKEYGIACSSYGTYFKFGKDPIEQLPEYIRAAKCLNTNILRLWCGTKQGGEYSAEEKQELFAQCKEAAKLAEAHGVILCMECHKKTYTQRLTDAIELMQEVNSPHFRMYWQPFQWQSVEDNLAYAAAIAPYTCHVHVFQWKDKTRFPLAEGVDEWTSYLTHFPAPRALLLEFMPDDQLSTLAAESAALKTIAGGRL